VRARQALDTRCVAQQTQIETLRSHAAQLKQREREWRKEKSRLLYDVDRNTSSAILRREELHFTRTAMLKEQLRLRGELERKPLPEADPPGNGPLRREGQRAWDRTPSRPTTAEPRTHDGGGGDGGGDGDGGDDDIRSSMGGGGGGAWDGIPPTPAERQVRLVQNPESPREKRLRTPSHRPSEPPPSTFVHGLSPRAPRSLDNVAEFEEQVCAWLGGWVGGSERAAQRDCLSHRATVRFVVPTPTPRCVYVRCASAAPL
jgi:hypothetical protein